MQMKFQPGRSGNPKGRPRKQPTVIEKAGAHAPAALDRLVEIMAGDDPQAAATAAITIINIADKDNSR